MNGWANQNRIFLGHVSSQLTATLETCILYYSDVNIHIYFRYWYTSVSSFSDDHETAVSVGRPKKICGCLSTGSDAVVHAFTSSVSPTSHCARDISHQSVDAELLHSYFSERVAEISKQDASIDWIIHLLLFSNLYPSMSSDYDEISCSSSYSSFLLSYAENFELSTRWLWS